MRKTKESGKDQAERKKKFIEAAPPKSLLAVLNGLSPVDEQFPPVAELASDTVEI